jgi:hypothetical protein
MTKKEYLEKIACEKVDEEKVAKVEEVYGNQLPKILKQIVSHAESTEFLDDGGRILALNEILDATKDLHVDFQEKNMIPMVDCGENDFIVYHFNDAIWSKFNIIEECVFKKKNTLNEVLGIV